MSWEVKRFSQIMKIKKGEAITRATENEGVYPVILGGQEPAYYIDRYNHEGKAIVVSRSGASAGYVSCWNEPIFITDGFLVEPINRDYYTEYLYYLLKFYGKPLRDLQNGSAIPHVTPKTIYGLRAPIPGYREQVKIADDLSTYDNLIEVNNKRIKVLEQMAENLYKEWFVRFRFPGHETTEFENGIPKGWTEQRLDQFGITLDSGSRPSGGVDDSLEDGMPSLGAETVNGLGEFDYDNIKLIPFDYYASMKRGKNTGSDILVYKDGAYIGKTTIFMNGFPYKHFAVNEHVFLLNAVDAEYQLYLYFTLHLPEFYALMQNLNKNAAQPGLSKQDMNRIKIVVPTKTIIRRFNSEVEPILSQVFNLAKEKKNLTKQRDLLLPRLMSGKLEV